ncbi:hypothetical protein QJQ45_014559, partial [Haematococcus lacustris]
ICQQPTPAGAAAYPTPTSTSSLPPVPDMPRVKIHTRASRANGATAQDQHEAAKSMEQLTVAHAALTVAHATLTTELLSSLINKHIQALYEYLYEHSQQVRELEEELAVLVQVLVQCLDVLVNEGAEKLSSEGCMRNGEGCMRNAQAHPTLVPINGADVCTADVCKVEGDERAAALVLGGSALLRADGLTHFGVRKLLSGLQGVEYEGGDWLPKVVDRPKLPILLCRGNMDNPVDMLSKYMQARECRVEVPPSWTQGRHAMSE